MHVPMFAPIVVFNYQKQNCWVNNSWQSQHPNRDDLDEFVLG